jgi:hypothetical protein
MPTDGPGRRAFLAAPEGRHLFGLAARRFRALDLKLAVATARPAAVTPARPRLEGLSADHRRILDKALDFAHRALLLQEPPGGAYIYGDVLAYLTAPPSERPVHALPGRGLRLEDLRQEPIGFWPPGRGAFASRLLPGEVELAQEVGLLNERGAERLRGRVVYGSVVAAGCEVLEGRFFGSEEERKAANLQKYLSTDWKPLGFRDDLRPDQDVLVVEGLSDSFSFRSACRSLGMVPRVVALLGASVAQHAVSLFAPGQRVLEALDGDDSGRRYAAVLEAGAADRGYRLEHVDYSPFPDPGSIPPAAWVELIRRLQLVMA